MSDDQDGCEWVSVSSSTGLPGTWDQGPLNGCVRVCVRVCVCELTLNFVNVNTTNTS